jgi:hypothetical protein
LIPGIISNQNRWEAWELLLLQRLVILGIALQKDQVRLVILVSPLAWLSKSLFGKHGEYPTDLLHFNLFFQSI